MKEVTKKVFYKLIGQYDVVTAELYKAVHRLRIRGGMSVGEIRFVDSGSHFEKSYFITESFDNATKTR